jgi:hypothetical protein
MLRCSIAARFSKNDVTPYTPDGLRPPDMLLVDIFVIQTFVLPGGTE